MIPQCLPGVVVVKGGLRCDHGVKDDSNVNDFFNLEVAWNSKAVA